MFSSADNENSDIGFVALENTATHTLFSEKIQQNFLIDVFLPLGYKKKESEYQFPKYPVVYIVNSRPLAIMAASGRQVLQLARELPLAIIVGIGYADEEGSPENAFAWQTRDFTPTSNKTWEQASTSGAGGGAEAFLGFIDAELKPFINKVYSVKGNDQTLAGHSFGGLFATYVLFNSPDSFDRYIISSPSLWWDGGVSFEYEDVFSRSHNNLTKRVFLSVGDGDFKSGPQDIVENTEKMYRKLTKRNYAGLHLKHVVFEGKSHASVMSVSIQAGMKAVFQ